MIEKIFAIIDNKELFEKTETLEIILISNLLENISKGLNLEDTLEVERFFFILF